MGFSIKYTDETGTHERELNPGPSDVEYPEADAVTIKISVDGNPVIQRPLRDGRLRKWIFQGWGKGSEPYATQWAWLETQTGKARNLASLDYRVGIWEDVSGIGGFERYDDNGNKVYTTVRITQVNRVPRSGGGPVRYDSALEFYIEDPSYLAF